MIYYNISYHLFDTCPIHFQLAASSAIFLHFQYSSLCHLTPKLLHGIILLINTEGKQRLNRKNTTQDSYAEVESLCFRSHKVTLWASSPFLL